MRILPQQVDWLELEGFTTTVMNAETVQGKSQIAARREVVQNLPTSEQLMSIIVTAHQLTPCLLYTSDAADEEDSVDLGGRRIIKKKT